MSWATGGFSRSTSRIRPALRPWNRELRSHRPQRECLAYRRCGPERGAPYQPGACREFGRLSRAATGQAAAGTAQGTCRLRAGAETGSGLFGLEAGTDLRLICCDPRKFFQMKLESGLKLRKCDATADECQSTRGPNVDWPRINARGDPRAHRRANTLAKLTLAGSET